MIDRLIAVIVAGFALWQCTPRNRGQPLSDSQVKLKSKPREITTWEGEGGALKTSLCLR